MRAPIAIALMLSGCAAKRVPVPPAPVVAVTRSATREFVDLEAGWRLRIIAPVTRSGSKLIALTPVQSDEASRTVTLKASDDLIGFETALYTVAPRSGGGVEVHFASAEMTQNGIAAPIETAKQAVLHLPRQTRYVRLFFMVRKSESDHEMVIAGVDRLDRLAAFTGELKDNPAQACRTRSHTYCQWIPAGMAVRPEVMKTVNGVERWTDLY